MSAWTYTCLIGAALIIAILFVRQRRRSTAIRALATRSGFSYLGRTLPRSLTLNGTPIGPVTSAWNVIDGQRHGIRVVAFDCQIGVGKGSWRRTVIAAESAADVFGAVAFNHDLETDRSGSWLILYQPKALSAIPPGLMPVAELEAHLNAI
jgi:hypothetical protein